MSERSLQSPSQPSDKPTEDAPNITSGFAPPSKDLLLYSLAFLMIFAAVGYLVSLAATATAASTGGLAIDPATGTIRVYIIDEPPQLDSSRATDQVSFLVLGHVMEGLARYNEHDQLIPGVAERWEIRDDGATFWLRSNARWSDGKPVTAHDFVFAWRTVLKPETTSEYAFIMFGIENAEAVNRGDLPPEQLGVTATHDHQLDIRFSTPTPFFDKLTAFSVFFPIREDFYKAQQGRYGADAENLLFNGPFDLTQWVHSASLKLERSTTYWNQNLAKLNAIEFPYVTNDAMGLLNLFRDQKIAWAPLSAETLNKGLEERWMMDDEVTGSVYFLEFNHRPGRLTNNVHLRRALQLVSDSSELVNRVIKVPSYKAGVSLFPDWIRGMQGSFREEFPPPQHRVDLAAARKELELAKQELRLTEIPPLVLLTSDSPTANKQAEYFQEVFERTLGLEVRIDKQIFKQRLAKMTAGDFDMVAAGWGPDYNDPLTFGDLFASWNLNNRGRYNNPALDAQVRIAQASLDQRTRLEAFAEIQRILYDDAVIIPNYEEGKIYVQDPRLQGVVRRVVGHSPDYTYAQIVEAPTATAAPTKG